MYVCVSNAINLVIVSLFVYHVLLLYSARSILIVWANLFKKKKQ
jgi:hypothetical protein